MADRSTSAVIEKYELDVRLFTAQFPFECDASLTLSDACNTIAFYLHPELEITTVQGAEGTALPFETELVLYPIPTPAQPGR